MNCEAVSCVLCGRALLKGDPFFCVPEVVDELTTKRIIAMELVSGVPLDRCVDLDQETRNEVHDKPGHFGASPLL